MPKFLQVILTISLYSTLPVTYAKTIFYDGNGSPETSGWFVYGQLPFPESLLPASLPALPSSLKALIGPSAEGVGSPTLNTDLGSGNKGYAGYSNYQYTLPELNLSVLLGGASKLKELLFSGSFEPVNANNPVFDNKNGFDLAFHVALTQEESKSNRAGFNVVVITNDGKGIELGFKKDKTADRIFAQSETFKEAEDTSALTLDLSSPTDYVLTVKEDSYILFVNEQEILSGNLRQYEFDPAKSSPALPFNPYTTPNFLFLGDDTDQGNATFTLGEIAMNLHIPVLGQAYAINAQGEHIETTTQFNGGITVNGQAPQTQIVQNLSDEVEVSGEISLDAQHVGQLADIVVYAAYKPAMDSPKEEEVFYMLDQDHNILLWDGVLENLVSFQATTTLSAKQFVQAYQGKFLLPGHLCISFGYLLQKEGSLITNDQCIEVTIKE